MLRSETFGIKLPDFTFIDLFAGIGGIRLGFESIGGRCLFSSEWDTHCQKTYNDNFGEIPSGDINNIEAGTIPKHDILCAGFPCQPFSISGRKRGFEDTRGTLIYKVFEVIQSKEPKVVFLENVKHLVHHDQGNTLKTILRGLEDLGYIVSWEVLNATDFGVPQNRERIIIIGHKEKSFLFSKIKKQKKVFLRDFLDTDGQFEFLDEPYTLIENPILQKSGLIFAGYRNKPIRVNGTRPGTEHLSRVHKQPNRIYSTEGTHPTISSQETSGRFWILHKNVVRKLTINECFRIMGFPDSYKKNSPKVELYKQIGNSVCVSIPPNIKQVNQVFLRV
jgi:DNA (cytosine-5)-methyltransferase 1